MIRKIKQHYQLQQFIETECCENNIEAAISEDINSADYVILDIDEYYQSLKLSKKPPSVDCLIIIKCNDGNYKLILVELKNLNTDQSIDKSNIVGKFKTTLNDFLLRRHPGTFSFKDKLKDFEMYLVTNPYHWLGDILINERLKGTRLNFLNTMKPLRYNRFIKKIKLELPNPTIQKC